MPQERQVLGRIGGPNKRKSEAEPSVGASNRLRMREALREKEQRKLLDPRIESQEHEAHSAFLDDVKQDPIVQKAFINSTKLPSSASEDLDSELDAADVRRAQKDKSRKILFEEPAGEGVSKGNVALLNSEMPGLGSPTRMRRTPSIPSENLQSPKATRENNSTSVVKNFTPVKLHIAKEKVKDKEKGMNMNAANGVVSSPSGCKYMLKVITKRPTEANKKNLNVSLMESINEVIAGNLYRLYLGKDKAPAIGLCTSNLTQEQFIGVSSAMFNSFTELKANKILRSDRKPDGFEAIMVTSLFLGDTDPNGTNLGFNENNELSKIDHGRAFLVSFKNGKDFLYYLFALCEALRYPYRVSYSKIAEQLSLIKELGWENIESRVSDAFAQIESNIEKFHSLPFYFLKYDPKRWVDPLAWAHLLAYIHIAVVKVDSWEVYKQHITSMLRDNFSVIDDALAYLSQEQDPGAGVQIHPMPPPRHIQVRKDFLVEIGVIDKGVVFPVKDQDLPFRDELLNKDKLMSHVEELTSEKLPAILEAINAKQKPEADKILDAAGLSFAMGLPGKRKPLPVIKIAESVTIAYTPNAEAVMLPAPKRELSHASAPPIVSHQSYVEKLHAEMPLPLSK